MPEVSIKVDLQPKQAQLRRAIIDLQGPCVIGFGGSRGAAKSGGIRRIALWLAFRSPVTIWIVRRVWDDLSKDHIDQMWKEYPELESLYRAGKHELVIPCAGGGTSSIFFIHSGDSARAKRKARGPQAHYIFIEQAEEFSQEEIEHYDGSNRAPGVAPGFCKKILTFNPGGIGTAYLRRVMWQRKFLENEEPKNFLFIQGFGWDNYEWFRGIPNAPTFEDFYGAWGNVKVICFRCREKTEQQKKSCMDCGGSGEVLQRFDTFIRYTDFGKKLNQKPPSERIGELMGSFEHFSGQYYADVWEESSIMLPVDVVTRLIKPWWRRWIATDWGFSHYAATGWFASGMLTPEELEDYFGLRSARGIAVVILYRELVCSDVTEPDMARLVVSMTPDPERREVRFYFIGQDAWAKRGSANTVVEQMEPILAAGGLPRLDKADWDRVGGWRLIYNAFASSRRVHHPGLDQVEDIPPLFISAACVEVQQAIPLLVSDYDAINRPTGDPKDVRKTATKEDDVADMLRYGLKSYLAAEPGIPADVERERLAAKYDKMPPSRNGPDENMTNKMMALQKLEEKQRQGSFLRRRLRG